MRALFVFVILQLVVVRGDARFRRENDQPQLDVERRGFHGRQENGPLGAMMAPRADPGAVASEICGFLGGEINQPWVCAVDTNYCVIEPIEGVIGCCYSNYCGAFRTACFAQTDPCDSACSSNPQNLVCVGDNPICATYSYPGHITEVRCESTIPTQLNVAYTYTGFSTPILLPRVVAGFSITSQGAGFSYLSISTGTQGPTASAAAPSSTPTSTFATSTSSSALTTSTTVLATTSNTALSAASSVASSVASSSSTTTASPSNSAPVGAIVGGVIGSLAIVSAFAALVILLRYKKNQAPPPDPYYQVSNNPASAFQIPSNALAPANDRKDDHSTWSMVTEVYVPSEMPAGHGAFRVEDHYVSSQGQPNELPGQMRWP